MANFDELKITCSDVVVNPNILDELRNKIHWRDGLIMDEDKFICGSVRSGHYFKILEEVSKQNPDDLLYLEVSFEHDLALKTWHVTLHNGEYQENKITYNLDNYRGLGFQTPMEMEELYVLINNDADLIRYALDEAIKRQERDASSETSGLRYNTGDVIERLTTLRRELTRATENRIRATEELEENQEREDCLANGTSPNWRETLPF